MIASRSELTTVAAMAVSFGTMDWISGGVIAALVLLNVSVGSYTEWEAEKVGHLLETQLTSDRCISRICWRTPGYCYPTRRWLQRASVQDYPQ